MSGDAATLERLLAISDALHRRVQRFATGGGGDGFEALALDIARFQAEASPGYRRLLESRGRALRTLDDLAPVPVEAFRVTRVAAFPAELDAVRFFTSGTTGAERGAHVMRRTDTYERLSLAFGRQALLPDGAQAGAVVVALAPPPSSPPGSSLGFMMARFMKAFDGRPLDAGEAGFQVSSKARWLLRGDGVDLDGLRRAARAAKLRGEPVLLLGTAFAFVHAVDALGSERLPLPPGSVVMQTGGFKGRSREVSQAELRASLARVFALDPARVVGEYGMTELTSQLYESSVAESALAARRGPGSGVYFEPPWLRVVPLEPADLKAAPDGEPGLACFIDLGNVDSAVCLVTQDLVRRARGGVELLGRQPGAPPRGCSLAVEALLHG